MAAIREFHYTVSSPARGHRPGHHRGVHGVTGLEFRRHAPLQQVPDARRLDVRASLRDPFRQWQVRVYSQRASIPVALVADLSASMGFAGRTRKLDVLADFTAATGYTAWRTGDAFGFIGCDETVRPDFMIAPVHARSAAFVLRERLLQLMPAGRNADGLTAAHQYLGRRRALVFLVSDFHFPLSWLETVLDSLALHEVVPVTLWDAREFELPPRPGLGTWEDSESGKRRVLLVRPRLRARLTQRFVARRAALEALFLKRGLRPLFITDDFSADALTRHFLSGASVSDVSSDGRN
jgi:hypothetical protein